MTTNHEHLRKVAEKATPGPWEKELYGRRYCVSRTDTRSNVCTSFGSHQPAEDADFIATFNPATAIALLDELAALRKENEGLRAAAEFASNVCAEIYAKYQLKIGPFVSQAQVANVKLRAAIGDSHE